MSRGGRTKLTEILEVLKLGGLVAGQVKHCVLESASVSIRKDETIAVDPVRIGRGILHDLAPQNVSHGSASHGSTGVTRVGRLDHVGRDSTDSVDTLFFEGFGSHC